MKPFCAFIAMVALGLAGGQAFAQEAVSARGHFADLNRARIYYEDHGSGEPLIVTRGPGEKDPEVMKRYTLLHGESRGLQLAQQFWRFRNLYDDPAFTPDKLATISARTLIVHGDNDFVPIEQALEMYHAIPHARLWIVPNGGHLPYLAQDNHVDFMRRVTEFLQGKWDTQSK